GLVAVFAGTSDVAGDEQCFRMLAAVEEVTAMQRGIVFLVAGARAGDIDARLDVRIAGIRRIQVDGRLEAPEPPLERLAHVGAGERQGTVRRRLPVAGSGGRAEQQRGTGGN